MNIREVSLLILCMAFINTIVIGWSIRDYYDKKDYIPMIISIGLAIIVILIGRFMYRVAFKINKEKK